MTEIDPAMMSIEDTPDRLNDKYGCPISLSHVQQLRLQLSMNRLARTFREYETRGYDIVVTRADMNEIAMRIEWLEKRVRELAARNTPDPTNG